MCLQRAVVGGADVCSKHSTAVMSFLFRGVVGGLLSAQLFRICSMGNPTSENQVMIVALDSCNRSRGERNIVRMET